MQASENLLHLFPQSKSQQSDFVIENYGSVLVLRPLTDAALDWVSRNIDRENSLAPYWPDIAIEHSSVPYLIDRLRESGLAVR